jgi:hypothetical protein
VPLFVGRIVDPGGNLKLAKFEPVIEKVAAPVNCDESGYDASVSGEVGAPCREASFSFAPLGAKNGPQGYSWSLGRS